MIAEQLKKALLQAAIEGKLTHQLPSDGDARDLLLSKKNDKNSKKNDNKICSKVAPLELSEEERPFDIPENWCWARLGDLGETNIGLTYSPADICTNGTLVLRSSNIKNNKLDYVDVVYVKCGIPDSKKCHINDILICARNGSKKLVGKAAIIDKENLSFGAFMAIFRSEYFAYIFYYLGSPYFRADFEGVNTTTINQITQENLKNRIIPLPPKDEQIRIVEQLERMLPEIEKLEKDEKKLDELQQQFPRQMKNAILHYAIQGKITIQSPEDGNARQLVDSVRNDRSNRGTKGKRGDHYNSLPISEDEIPFEIPDNWCWARIGEIVDRNVGGGTPDKNAPEYWGGNIPWASVKDLNCVYLTHTIDHISQSGLQSSSSNLIPKGNIIICTRMGIGKIVFNDIDVAINQDLRALFLSDIVDQKYFFYYYQTLVFDGKGATVKGITLPELNNTLIPIPPKQEQTRIVRKLEEILLRIDSINQL